MKRSVIAVVIILLILGFFSLPYILGTNTSTNTTSSSGQTSTQSSVLTTHSSALSSTTSTSSSSALSTSSNYLFYQSFTVTTLSQQTLCQCLSLVTVPYTSYETAEISAWLLVTENFGYITVSNPKAYYVGETVGQFQIAYHGKFTDKLLFSTAVNVTSISSNGMLKLMVVAPTCTFPGQYEFFYNNTLIAGGEGPGTPSSFCTDLQVFYVPAYTSYNPQLGDNITFSITAA